MTSGKSYERQKLLFTRHHDNGYLACVEQQGERFVAGCVIPRGSTDAGIAPLRCASLASAMETADKLAHDVCTRHCGKWTIHEDARE